VESILLSRTCLVGAVLGCGESERSGAGCQGSCLYARDCDGIESDGSSLVEQCKPHIFKSRRRGRFPDPKPTVASGQTQDGAYIQEQPLWTINSVTRGKRPYQKVNSGPSRRQ
jgi:hypothetical protein